MYSINSYKILINAEFLFRKKTGEPSRVNYS